MPARYESVVHADEVSQRSGQGLPYRRPARVGAYFESQGVTRYGDRRVLLKGLLLVAVTVGLYALILSNRLAGLPLLLAALLFGVACILVSFNLAHDAAHDALTPSRRLNHAHLRRHVPPERDQPPPLEAAARRLAPHLPQRQGRRRRHGRQPVPPGHPLVAPPLVLPLSAPLRPAGLHALLALHRLRLRLRVPLPGPAGQHGPAARPAPPPGDGRRGGGEGGLPDR